MPLRASGVKVLFTHDTELALQAAAALVNTAPDAEKPDDDLGSVGDLDAFLTTWSWTGRRRATGEDLRAVRALRPRIRRAWEVDEVQVVELVNELLRDGQALPQVVDHDDFGWHVHATEASAPWEHRIAVEAAMALIDVLRAGEVARLKICARPECSNVFVDLSKNRSKRFCDTTCGNRENVAAYRARLADQRPPGL